MVSSNSSGCVLFLNLFLSVLFMCWNVISRPAVIPNELIQGCHFSVIQCSGCPQWEATPVEGCPHMTHAAVS